MVVVNVINVIVVVVFVRDGVTVNVVGRVVVVAVVTVTVDVVVFIVEKLGIVRREVGLKFDWL